MFKRSIAAASALNSLTLALAVGSAVMFTSPGEAATVQSEKVPVNIARVVEVVPLVKKPGFQISTVVQDLGGSTDVSPTQKVFFTIYKKGEMFSTDAAFPIADINALVAAKRVSPGIYSITTNTYGEGGMNHKQTFVINATEAIKAIKNVTCPEEMDCDASTNFASQIDVTER